MAQQVQVLRTLQRTQIHTATEYAKMYELIFFMSLTNDSTQVTAEVEEDC